MGFEQQINRDMGGPKDESGGNENNNIVKKEATFTDSEGKVWTLEDLEKDRAHSFIQGLSQTEVTILKNLLDGKPDSGTVPEIVQYKLDEQVGGQGFPNFKVLLENFKEKVREQLLKMDQ